MKRKKFDGNPGFGDTSNKYLKTKAKSYNGKITTIFHGKVPKQGLKCNVDSVFKLRENYYRQTFLEECKYKIKKIEMKSLVEDDLESSFDDDSRKEDFDENSELSIMSF